MTKPMLGATDYNKCLETIRAALATSLEALYKLNDEDLTQAQAVLLMAISNAQLSVSHQVSVLEKYGESVREIDRLLKTGQMAPYRREGQGESNVSTK